MTLAIPCYKRYDLLAKLVQSAEAGTRKPDRYAIVDCGGWSKTHTFGFPPNTEILDFGGNIGLPKVWNRLLGMYPDWVIFSNDDVELGPHLIENLAKAADESSALFLFPEKAGAMFCVALIKHACWEKVGPFDEAFWPGYFEDNDYHHRMKVLGIEEKQVEDCSYYHHVSATLRTLSQEERAIHNQNFARNKDYYIRKWGGMPHGEKLKIPNKVQR